MPPYYFDIETTGLDPEEDSIITAQYQELPKPHQTVPGHLKIFTIWDHNMSEKALLAAF